MAKKTNNEGKWKRKITKGTTRRLLRWSHFNFRQILIAKGEEMGTEVNVGTEEWSSKTCTFCLKINHNLKTDKNTREIQCSGCGLKIHRDLNGARNILMMNWKENYRFRRMILVKS